MARKPSPLDRCGPLVYSHFMSEENQKKSGPGTRAAMQLAVLGVLIAALGSLYVFQDYPVAEDQAVDGDLHNELARDATIIARPDPLAQREPERAFGGRALRLSPDGEQLAFLRGPRFRRDIWIAPRQAPANAAPLGLSGDQGVLSFEWALNGTHILFRRPFDLSAQIYAVDTTGGEAYALNPLANSAVGDVTLSPAHPNKALIRIGPSPGMELDLHLLDIPRGTLQLIEQRGTVTEYYPDQNLDVRAGRTVDTQGVSVFARREAGWEEVAAVARAPGEHAGVLFYHAAQNRIFLLDHEDRESIALSSIDLITGAREEVAASEDGDVTRVLRDPATWDILAYAVDSDGVVWHALDQNFAGEIAQLNALPGAGARVVSQSLDNRFWIVESDEDFFLLDRDQDSFQQIRS